MKLPSLYGEDNLLHLNTRYTWLVRTFLFHDWNCSNDLCLYLFIKSISTQHLFDLYTGCFKKKFWSFFIYFTAPKHLQKKLRVFSNSPFGELLENVKKLNDWVNMDRDIYKIVKTREKQDWIALGSKPIDLFVVVVPVS